MTTAKRPLTIRALMTTIAGMALLTAAPGWSPALAVPAAIAAALLVGFLIVRYVPTYPVVGTPLDELLVLILGVVLAAGIAGSPPSCGRCGAIAAPGALTARYGNGLNPGTGSK